MHIRSRLPLAFLSATLLFGCTPPKADEIKWRYADALIFTSRNPLPCVSPTPREKALLELSASAIELGNIAEPNALDMGAQRLLGNGIYRYTNKVSYPICVPDGLYGRVTRALNARGGLGKGRLVDYQLALAAKLDHPNESVVDAIAQIAFATTPQQSEIFRDKDIRPYARAVLASFGRSAAKYAGAAFQQIGSDTPMETGAAQIAAAAGHPQALQRVVTLIDETLSTVESGKAIPWAKRNRLYELAWAISFAGKAGRQHANSLHKIMSKRVESAAPPFGMITAYPKQMCKALKYLEDQEALRQYAYCVDDSVLYEH